MRSAVSDIRRSVLPIYHQHQVFISLLDGKTPLSFWLLALSRVSSQGDPLLAARILSVTCGMASGWLLFAIGTRLACPAAGLITSALYAILPFGLFYDRIAYTESYVNLTGITLAYVSLLALRGRQPGAPVRGRNWVDSWGEAICVAVVRNLASRNLTAGTTNERFSPSRR